jgi:hypothetical protein
LLDAGADPSDVSKVMRYAAYSAVFSTLVRLDEAHDYDTPFPEGATGWKVMEIRIGDDAASGELTGRDLAGLTKAFGARTSAALKARTCGSDTGSRRPAARKHWRQRLVHAELAVSPAWIGVSPAQPRV